MCIECWEDAGSPTTWNEQIERAVELLRDLYRDHPTGGPLHVHVDDYNLDGTIEPYYDCYSDADLDALYYDGWPIADLDPGAPAVVENLGVSLRHVCDELAVLLNAMPVSDRYAAVARYDGYIGADISADKDVPTIG